jgi:hypothetical protein
MRSYIVALIHLGYSIAQLPFLRTRLVRPASLILQNYGFGHQYFLRKPLLLTLYAARATIILLQ